MNFIDRYPLVVTPMKDSSRDFWTSYFDFQIIFDSSWFTLLASQDGATSIAFMTPDHPSAPPGSETFNGIGMCLELEVQDATATYNDLKAQGLDITYSVTNESYGQRRFGFSDPSGLWIDIVEQIEPSAGYWDKYMLP